MGIAYSCPGADGDGLDESFGAHSLRSISFKGEDAKAAGRNSFNERSSEPSILKALGSGKMIIEGSLSFKGTKLDQFEVETTFSIKTPRAENEGSIGMDSFENSGSTNSQETALEPTLSEQDRPKHEAAVKLQKVYKSFRTRRQLADCAVLVEQRWWKLLDFALLKRSSISFFDHEKPESVVSRWSRARTRAAKVGKGLSKNEKAQKLALQHWLEAIDPRHRYGHNLHLYYVCWLHCESRQPFFYWLDVGEGKEVNLERCPRSKLQQQCIKYLGPKEREAYEVMVEDGKFIYKLNRQLVDTSEGKEGSKWIFVLSTSKTLYVGQKRKGKFQHSSFLAGGATCSAGRLVVEKGLLKAIWPHSGHYCPTEENFQEFVSFLKENNVDLTDVKKSPTEDEEESWRSVGTNSFRSISSQLILSKDLMAFTTENLNSEQDVELQQPHTSEGRTSNAAITNENDPCQASEEPTCSSSDENQESHSGTLKEVPAFDRVYDSCVQNLFRGFDGESDEDADDKTSYTEVAERINSPEGCKELGRSSTSSEIQPECDKPLEESTSKQHYMFHKQNLFEEDQDENGEPPVPQELILKRINSMKGMKSLQLGRQLSCKWTTGAGPRIGCVRDYPSELQFQALEQVNLSPRSAWNSKVVASPRKAASLSPKSPGPGAYRH